MHRLSASKTTFVLFVAALFIGAGFGGAQNPEDIPTTTLLETSLGFALDDDFNADDGGWTASEVPEPWRPDPTDVWEWGAPTSGPGVAYSGDNVWATNLDGTYNARDCAALLSPPIDLTDATSASVSFMQWRHMQQFGSGSMWVYDAGRVYVTSDGGDTLALLDPDQPYDGYLSSASSKCFDGAPNTEMGFGGPVGSTPPAATAWSPISADLSAFAGQTVQVVVAFTSNCCTHYAGWYVDDFAVTVDGITTVEDFETDDGGFSVVSTAEHLAPQGWSHGEATYGPAHDSPLWATNPDGDYGHKECATVESPAFVLGQAEGIPGAGVVSAALSWNNWYRSNSLYAAGIVQLGTADGYVTLTPENGYPGTISGSYADQLVDCLGVEVGSRAFSGFHDLTGQALKPQRADVSDYIGQEVTVRFAFASAWSDLNPSTQAGWYVDDVAVELRVAVEGPDAQKILEGAGGITEQQRAAPGWSIGGELSTWDWGIASAGPEGELVMGTNLTGTHSNYECSWVDSPALPGAVLAQDPTLSFEHWYDIYPSSTAGAAWSGAVVLVSTDGGETWTYLDLAEYTLEARYTRTNACIKALDPTIVGYPMVFSGSQPFFDTVEVDLSEFADAESVQVRFLFSSGIAIYRDGWFLRSVEMGGVQLL